MAKDKRVSLSELYESSLWYSRPDNEVARGRFRRIREYFLQLVDRGVLRTLAMSSEARILDVMAASGIAGVALASTLARKGVKVRLMVTDAREDELRFAHVWAELAGVSDELDIETKVVDSRELPRALGDRSYDAVLVWGSSLPHLNPFELHLLLSGARELHSDHGVLLIEQASVLPKILVNNAFRHTLVEGGVLTIYSDYNEMLGVQKRLVFRLPDLTYLGVIEMRLWELSQIVSSVWVYYREVNVESFTDMNRLTKVIIARSPRDNVPRWRDLYESLPYDKEWSS